MRVLHLSIGDSFLNGGGAIAMRRLHQALLSEGADSEILCEFKRLDTPRTSVIQRSQAVDRFEKLLSKATIRFGLHDIHRVLSSREILKTPQFKNADVINLHCMHGGYSSFFSYPTLPALTRAKPTVYTLHDMWPLTGHCTFSYDCERWKTGCGRCPYPDVYPELRRDATQLEWKLKRWVFNHSKMAVICPSRWMVNQAEQSLMSHLPIHYIPHGIDTTLFKPLDQQRCRAELDLPLDKQALMFAAAGLKEQRKGADVLWKALETLPNDLKDNLVLLLVGDSGEGLSSVGGIQSINLGGIHQEGLLAKAYSAADLFLFPTRADTFGLVAQEAIACGTPVVSFRIGGVPDLVRHGITGYLAEPENIDDFRSGVVQLLRDDALRRQMGKHSRAIALEEYSLKQYGQQHLSVYRQLIATGDGGTPIGSSSTQPQSLKTYVGL